MSTDLQEYISDDLIKEESGESNLNNVTYLELIVNTTEQTLSNLGEKVPNLSKLKLNNSIVKSVRDLGTSMKRLRVLWLNRCGLSSLDGIAGVSRHLKELYVSYNDIKDLSPLQSLNLEILDLECNLIDDLSQIYYLHDCKRFYSLTLSSNPIKKKSETWYRKKVHKILPQLRILDDYKLTRTDGSFCPKRNLQTPNESLKKTVSEIEKQMADQKQELEILQNSLKYARIDEHEDLLINPRILIASDKYLHFEERKSYLQQRQRPGTALGLSKKLQKYYYNKRPGTSCFQNRPNTARSKLCTKTKPSSNDNSSHSSLTYGSQDIIAGNIAKSLRRRKQKEKTMPPKQIAIEPDLSNNGDMLEEVMAYKLSSHEKLNEQVDSMLANGPVFSEADFTKADPKAFQSIETKNIPSYFGDELFPTGPMSPQSSI